VRLGEKASQLASIKGIRTREGVDPAGADKEAVGAGEKSAKSGTRGGWNRPQIHRHTLSWNKVIYLYYLNRLRYSTLRVEDFS
jgi:hypothetical protein